MGNYNWPLIGHQHIKDYFAKALGAGKIHHAYLFEGPEQVGKATFAHMLAKTLLCEGSEKPCQTCRACQAYENQAHPDFLDLNPGDNPSISIESARKFISALATRPLLGAWRIGMIERADLLTAEAANALLKTLEEPGKQVVLFLISPTAVLSTIASRCQRIKFGFVPTAEIENSLIDVADAQGIASLAAGRPGQALAFQDPVLYEMHKTAIQEVTNVLSKDEGDKLLWISEQFGKRGNMKDKREECKEFLNRTQAVLRERLANDFTAASLLKKTMQAESLLKSNVDPRLVCEYLLLDHN